MSKWILVDEAVPAEGSGLVLIRFSDGAVYTAEYILNGNGGFWQDPDRLDFGRDEPAHWTRLPEPPNE